ncbi:hypothetical protein HO831_00445 [Streptococcus suis]|uniref:Phage tail fiber n=1 Tax=Streptococcus suis TaxID=1307 RepID=A0A822VNF0_STRSU|nr:hypothetical protein [Streptococcus suis]QBX21125.1 hypothetical protein Javan563_0006 [Streptococcus phage Javan563]QBX21246.1 hypothetical protein Javan567_0006 [Streptococcus phage Javan567]QBX21301.1 hypothetical protein Javan569_0006 [Streptococcus phage Javan569]QBX30998.1 hypothetical protein Javan590_0006 [Streptococcus phage Javan590]AGZ23281.1 hypothetical protein T15_1190 [Streptococcus suis T15]
MGIDNHLKVIKEGVFGRDVRQAIHDGIKQAYTDATIERGNTDMEVAKARGSFETLGNRFEDITERIQSITNGAPKGTFGSLSELQQSKPDGDTNIYLTTDNGHWNYYNGSAWVSGGTYQATVIKDGEITDRMLKNSYAYGTPGKNKFNKFSVTDGYYVDPSTGNLLSAAGNSVSEFIEVESNQIYQYTNLGTGAFYDKDKTFIKGTPNIAGWNLTPTPQTAFYVRVSCQNTKLGIAQIEKGSVATEYEPYTQIFELKSTELADLSGTKGLISYTEIIVKKDGSGDFVSPKLANDSITDASYNKRYNIIIHPGEYTEINWTPKDFVNLIGTDRDKVILKGELPQTATDVEITPASTINLIYNNDLENLTITCRNMRYPVHDDGGGTDKIRNVKNCKFIHYGNQAVRDYRKNNNLPAGDVWASENAYGSGVNSGDVVKYKDCVFVGTVNAWGTHNNEHYEKPAYIEHDNCEFILDAYDNPEFHNSIGIASMGSGNKDKIVFKGCRANGTIKYFYIGTDTIRRQDSKAEFEISGYNNDLAVEVQLDGERYIPVFKDECHNVVALENILKGQAVCFDKDKKHVRKMLPTDNKALFAGIALNDISAQSHGDVKFKGYLEKEDLNLSQANFGDNVVVGHDSLLMIGAGEAVGICLGYNQIKIF